MSVNLCLSSSSVSEDLDIRESGAGTHLHYPDGIADTDIAGTLTRLSSEGEMSASDDDRITTFEDDLSESPANISGRYPPRQG